MKIESTTILANEALALLEQLIALPSLSRQEDKTADCIAQYFIQKNIACHRLGNNVWASNQYFDKEKPSLLLNSHHDTVEPNVQYTHNPYQAINQDGKLYGLGSTDAGASLVSLLAAFVYFYPQQHLPYNIVFAASAEEEISGHGGIELLFKEQRFSSMFAHGQCFAIVGEPTELQLAIAEKGLLVLDCTAEGRAGHAARNEGDNAIYKAMKAIEWFQQYQFAKVSPTLGSVKMTVTSIETLNKAHNVVPATCSFVVDVRVTDAYSHEEILEQIAKHVNINIKPRSTRLRASHIALEHPIVRAGMALGKTTYGSPTASDQALIPLPSLKCGPGFSGQSHSANEFIEIKWIPMAVSFYIEWLQKMFGNI